MKRNKVFKSGATAGFFVLKKLHVTLWFEGVFLTTEFIRVFSQSCTENSYLLPAIPLTIPKFCHKNK